LPQPLPGNEVLLRSQHRSIHDTPTGGADDDAFLAAVVRSALAMQSDDGGLEIDPAGGDVGDTSLGVTSLLLLALSRGVDAPGLGEAVGRSVEFHLRRRVFRTDNPGYPNLRHRGSGVPCARYTLADGAHPFGDWPSTAWALLQAVNVLQLGPGRVRDELLDELCEVALGYWQWLTEVTFFNPQDTANQAIGAVVGALMLADVLDDRRGRGAGGDVRASAHRHYALLRSQRLPDLGALLPAEHGGAWDGNYGPASLSFLAQAHRVSGNPVFWQDGCELATYLDQRLGVRGFDVGGSRYVEQHLGFEAVLGLRYFSGAIGADIGRYLGNLRHHRLMDAQGRGDGSAAPNGHFAFMAVWTVQDDSTWHRRPNDANRRHQLRRGDVSVSFEASLAPHLVQVGGTALLRSVLDGQRGLAPAYRDGSRSHVLARPLAPVRSVEQDEGAWSAKLVHAAVATWDEVLVPVRTLYLTDGVGLHVVALLDPARLPAGCRLSMLAGLPYAEPSASGAYRKVLSVATPDGQVLDLGDEGATTTADELRLGGGAVLRGNGPLRLTNPVPPPGMGAFVLSSAATRDQTLEQVAFALAPDPYGYGNPEAALGRLLATNLIEVMDGEPVGDAVALAASYLPTGAPAPDLVVRAAGDDVLVRVGDLEALVGPAEGDERGEPRLRLTRSR
jgi:hypothetical protein